MQINPGSPEAADGGRSGRTIWVAALLMALATPAAFHDIFRQDFIEFDDPLYVTRNAVVQKGLTAEGLAWSWRTTVGGPWHPLTWWSHMLDVELWGLRPWGHKLSAVLLHTLSAVLLLFWLTLVTGDVWRPVLVAAVWAVHPLRVESVVWVSERKDVLSVLMGLATLLAYSRYVRASRGRRGGWYLLVFAGMALSLLAKPTLVTLPFLLLLLDVWPHRRLETGCWRRQIGRLLLEKGPLLGLSIAASVAAFWAQSFNKTVSSMEQLSVGHRVATAVVAYAVYLRQMIWPLDLAVHYPLPSRWPVGEVAASAAALAVITALAVWWGRRRPAAIIGWLWYLGTLVPVIGLVQIGGQSRADRYTYFPMIGVLIAVGWGLPWERLARRRSMAKTGVALAAAVLVALGVVTFQTSCYWRDTLTLFRRAASVTRNNAVAYMQLGSMLMKRRQFDEAAEAYRRAIEIKPRHQLAIRGYGMTLTLLGRFDEAARWFHAGVVDHQHAPAELQEALSGWLEQAIRDGESSVVVTLRVGRWYARQGAWDRAERAFSAVTKQRPDVAAGWLALAEAQLVQGRLEEAAGSLRELLALEPRSADGWALLARLHQQADRPDAARAAAQRVLELEPHPP